MAESVPSLAQNWISLEEISKELKGLKKSYTKSVDEFTKCQNDCLKAVQHLQEWFEQIEGVLLKREIHTKEGNIVVLDLIEKMEKCGAQLKEMQALLPGNNGLCLNAILGNVSVTMVDKDECMKYREEFAHFKLTISIVIFVMSLQSFLFSYRVLDSLLHFLLVWYYSTLTIRQSILLKNGDGMIGWGRLDYVFNTIQAGVILVWPDGMMYDKFRLQFTLYVCVTRILQFLEFNFRQAFLDRSRALDKMKNQGFFCRLKTSGGQHEMDIATEEEEFYSWKSKFLNFLLAFVYFCCAFQLYNAYTLYQLSKDPLCVEWQVFWSALIFFIQFLGNTLAASMFVCQVLSDEKKKSQ